MVISTGDFQRVAETVVQRTAELLQTEVSVVDPLGTVVASSSRNLVGRPAEQQTDRQLRVPLAMESGSGEVLIAPAGGGGEVVPPRIAHVLAELVINQATVVEHLPDTHQLKNKFIHDLLHGDISNEASILREAQVLGMDLAPPRVVILIDAAAYIGPQPAGSRAGYHDELVQLRIRKVIDTIVDFFELPSDTICAHIGNGEVAILKASNRKNLGAWAEQANGSAPLNPSWANLAAIKAAGAALLSRLRRETGGEISVGIGRYHAGLDGLARSYQDARAALSLGHRFLGPNRVVCLDDLGIAAFVGVSDEQTKIDLARYLLSPLDGEPELLETVQTYFEHSCCPTTTAEALHVHRNTLTYRLGKIHSLTGLDPRRFDEAVQIRVALCLRSLSAGRPD